MTFSIFAHNLLNLSIRTLVETRVIVAQGRRGTLTYSNASDEGEIRNGTKYGRGTMSWHTGHRYEGDWRDDKRTGQGTYTWPKGDRYVGEFRNGKLHGRGTLIRTDGSRQAGEWRDGKRVQGQQQERGLTLTQQQTLDRYRQRQAQQQQERNRLAGERHRLAEQQAEIQEVEGKDVRAADHTDAPFVWCACPVQGGTGDFGAPTNEFAGHYLSDELGPGCDYSGDGEGGLTAACFDCFGDVSELGGSSCEEAKGLMEEARPRWHPVSWHAYDCSEYFQQEPGWCRDWLKYDCTQISNPEFFPWCSD